MTRANSIFLSVILTPILAILIAPLLAGCEEKGMPDAVEKVPIVFEIADGSPLQKYVSEVSKEPLNEKPEALPSQLQYIVRGTIDWRDHNTNCSLWVVASHTGSRWGEGQKTYVYDERSEKARQISAFQNQTRSQAMILTDGDDSRPYILSILKGAEWWDGILCKCFIETSELKSITPCYGYTVSPDRSLVLITKMGGNGGFYSYHIWDVKSGRMKSIISIWESDEGSGQSWTYAWSEDSKVVAFGGTGHGFSKKHEGAREFHYLYYVPEDKMFSTTPNKVNLVK